MFTNSKIGLVEEFKKACEELGLSVDEQLKPPKPPGRKQFWRLTITSMLLYLLLKRYDEFMARAPNDVQLTFLRGLWLGDGHLKHELELINTDAKLIELVSTLLKVHGIRHSVLGPYPPRPPGKKPVYVVRIWEKSREKFLKLTGLIESPPCPC